MGHSRTPTQNTAGDGFPADPIGGYSKDTPKRAGDNDGYVRASIRDRCHQAIELAATGQLGMAAAGQIRLAVITEG